VWQYSPVMLVNILTIILVLVNYWGIFFNFIYVAMLIWRTFCEISLIGEDFENIFTGEHLCHTNKSGGASLPS
jgi:hypothetical protein